MSKQNRHLSRSALRAKPCLMTSMIMCISGMKVLETPMLLSPISLASRTRSTSSGRKSLILFPSSSMPRKAVFA